MQNQNTLAKIKNILAVVSLSLTSIILIFIILSGLGINLFPEPNVQKVTMTGHAERFIIPSSVQISVYISTNSTSKNEAVQQITSTESKVLSELNRIGVHQNDIIHPSFITSQSGGKYYISNTISFILKDIKKYNELEQIRLIPNVSSADQNKAQLLESSLVDNSLREELIRDATLDAKKQVENNAKLLGGKVGKVLGFDNVVKIEPYRTASIEKNQNLDPISLKLGYYVTAESKIIYSVDF